ncbi:MAG: NAD-dependent deacylase [Proteobacteria bacterium]|nr:NAD-dependent deacylase [Pseudomonadota bacterium]
MSEADIERLCDFLADSKCTIALTGAGISAESGIPTFRGVQGLWEKYDVMEFAHIDAFRRNPAKVWGMLLEMDRHVVNARPNPGHVALAQLEAMGLLRLVVTQNIDNLHQTAGSREVVEFHGNSKRLRCLECGEMQPPESVDPENLPPRCACGGLIKPDVIFFGEAIPWAANVKAFEYAQRCDLILVVGTSAVVAPASEIPVVAKRAGARIVEVNPEETPLTGRVTDLMLRGSAGEILPRAVRMLMDRRH